MTGTRHRDNCIMISKRKKGSDAQQRYKSVHNFEIILCCICIGSITAICEGWIQQIPFQPQHQQLREQRRKRTPICVDIAFNRHHQLNSKLKATKEDTKVWTASFETSSSSTKQRRQSRSSVQIGQQQPDVIQKEKDTSNGDQQQSDNVITTILEKEFVDDDAPAGIVGAEFFGGNKQKEEFFDPIAEAEALIKVVPSKTTTISLDESIPGSITTTPTTTTSITINEDDVDIIDRFISIDGAFDCIETRTLARDVQYQINQVLYDDSNTKVNERPQTVLFPYSTSLRWDTPFSKTTNNPLNELQKSIDFYRRIDVAIISGQKLSDTNYELRYEIAVTWPTLWEPRILLTGTSHVTLSTDKTTIIRQQDRLDQSNELVPLIVKQFIPRFWDIYHLGVAPSAEMNPRISIKNSKNAIASYKLYTIPPRIYLQPSINEQATNRFEQNTAFIPNHSFSCSIVTMGPLKQRYSTTSQIYISINNNKDKDNNIQLQWEIPLSVEYMSNTYLNIPSKDEDSMIDRSNQQCQYSFKPKRMYASVPFYGSSPQDEQVAAIRQQLYQKAVVEDKHQPALDSSGRVKFVFIQNNVKACFTENGFGMSIYDWRPLFAGPNEIGIELLEDSAITTNKNSIK
jgi:hypothetical protein